MHSTVVHHRFSYHSVAGSGVRGIVRGDVRCPAEGRGLVTVVICHGFKGFKEWGFFPYLAEQLAESGAYCVSFNFSHNGVGEDLLTFSEPERFRENTPTKECDELEELLGKLQRRELPESERCGGLTVLMGHSRGGFPVLVCSSEAEGRGLTGIVGVISSPR
jgi:hypothetical protein